MNIAMGTSARARAIPLVACLSLSAVGWGLWVRNERYIASGSGLGYGLGVAGLAAMTVLLAYSVRKRTPALREAGPIRSWFEVHMLLGILGPVAILFHSNFRTGSLNSTIALACTLVVSGSGLAGRSIYTRVHHGLSDRRRTVEELRRQVGALREDLEGTSSSTLAGLQALEALALPPEGGLFAALRARGRLARGARSLRRELRREPGGARDDLGRSLDRYLAAVASVARLAVYERVFALWHAFHLPLCFLLYASAAGHVVAVHLY